MAAYEQTITVKVKIEPADEMSRRFLQFFDQLPTAIDWTVGGVNATTTGTTSFPHYFDSSTAASAQTEEDPWRSARNTDTTGEDE